MLFNNPDDSGVASSSASASPPSQMMDKKEECEPSIIPAKTKVATSSNDDDDDDDDVATSTAIEDSAKDKDQEDGRDGEQGRTKARSRISHRDRQRVLRRQSSSFRKLGSNLRRQSSLLVDSLHSNLPTTPTGWAVLTTALASLGLQYELNLQDKLTAPPHVFCQVKPTAAAGAGAAAGGVPAAAGRNDKMERLYQKLAHPSGKVGSNDATNSITESKAPSSAPQHQQQSMPQQQGIFTRNIKPSLFIGSRGLFSSTAAYIMGDRNGNNTTHRVRRCREIMKMGADGALIALDWEIPMDTSNSNNNNHNHNHSANSPDSNYDTREQPPKQIDKPLVLLLHGMNNDSSFGYIRSMMRTATSRGWMACAINMRGQGGVELTTPRAYNAGFTGDLRGVILQLEKRLVRSTTTERRSGRRRSDTRGNANENKNKNENENDATKSANPTNPDNNNDGYDDDDDVIHQGGPIFLLGYSLGANIITKYLGEESLHGTLPKCLAGGAAMGNPLHIHSGSIAFPWNMVLAAGIKRSILQNYKTLKQFREPGYQTAVKKALMSPTIAQLDDTFSRYLIRNEGKPPYEMKLGYDGGGEEYWRDASSHRYVAHVSVPLLKISAQDDFLVFGQFAKKLNYCLENPNVIVVKTRCGGHLGWQESPPPSPSGNCDNKGRGLFGGSGSWSDVAVADFIEALLQIREEDREEKKKKKRMMERVVGGYYHDVDDGGDDDESTTIRNEGHALNNSYSPRQPKILSRL